jgi:glycosyltransferase involved in cell wall biosynthesis
VNRKFRVGYIVACPIHYQAPMLRYVARRPEIDLTVLFLSDWSVGIHMQPGFKREVKWDVPLLGGYNHRFLSSSTAPLAQWKRILALLGELREGAFDAVWIHGYSHVETVVCLFLARLFDSKVLLRGESNARSGRIRYGVPGFLKRHLLRVLFKTVDAFLPIGTLNEEFYQLHGAPRNRLFRMPYAVDNFFFQMNDEEAALVKAQLRADLNLQPGRPIILFASKLEQRKRASDLLQAYVHLSPDGVSEPGPYLLLIGDGPERAALEEGAGRTGWNSVRFLGFKNQSELPKFYHLCDVFVLVSEREPWALVVNEAMNARKPIILSTDVGAGWDLLADGENGYRITTGDIPGLTAALRRITEDPDLAARMGKQSFERINAWTNEQAAEGLVRALECTCE